MGILRGFEPGAALLCTIRREGNDVANFMAEGKRKALGWTDKVRRSVRLLVLGLRDVAFKVHVSRFGLASAFLCESRGCGDCEWSVWEMD